MVTVLTAPLCACSQRVADVDQYANPQSFADIDKQAKIAYDAGDFSKAAELWQQAADLGSADAQCNLGTMYMKGQGVPKDMDKAVDLISKAADHGKRRCSI